LPAALVAVALACGAGVSPAAAQAHRPVQVETVVMPDTVALGDPVGFRWRLWLPKGSRAAFPARPPDDSLHHWTAWTTRTLEAKGGLREHRLEATFQTFALGPVAVPGPPVRFRVPGEDARQGIFPTGSFVVLRTVPPRGPEPPLRDLKGLVAPPWWALVPWLWVGVAVVALALAIWLFRRWRKARGKKPALGAAADVPLDPPHVEARRRLAALVARGLPESGRVVEHGVVLADILHRFVERRFGSLQPGHTTSELARKLAGRADVEAADVVTLRGILDACDLTKFARRPYDAARAHAAEKEAEALIAAWTEAPAAPAVGAAATSAGAGGTRP
jgi:hypothetical protein